MHFRASRSTGRSWGALRALLPAVAILGPAMTLALLGLRAYRAEAVLLRDRFKRDQLALARPVVRLVAARLNERSRRVLDRLAERIRGGPPDDRELERFTSDNALARHVFVLRGTELGYPHVESPRRSTGQGQRLAAGSIYPASDLDVRAYIVRLRQERRLSRLVARGLRAEYRSQRARALALYRRAARGRGRASARALLGMARMQRRAGRTAAARETYRKLHRRFESLRDRQGISYALLADAGLAELGTTRELLRLHQRLLGRKYRTTALGRRFYLRWVTERLRRADSIDQAALNRTVQTTRRRLATLRFGRRLQRYGIAELQRQASERMRSVALDSQTILVLQRRGDRVLGYEVDESVLRATVGQRRPSATGVRIPLRLGRLGELPATASEQILHQTLLEPPLDHWTIAALRPRSDPVAALEKRGRLRQLGLVAGLIVLLTGGLFFTYRGVKRASELAQLKSDFASTVSHELKTPLTSIRMYAEMLQEGIANSARDRERYQHVIIRESERLGQLITNVLDFSRVERGTRRYDLRRENLAALTDEAVETFRRLSEGESVTIDYEPAGDLPAVTADREAALQSLLNLLSNAAKYSRSDPWIEVRLQRQGDEVGVAVSDRGIGIAAADQRRIFDDFYRAPRAREAGVEGTGLGLALVRRHMEACGGRVEVSSEPGEGSTFRLWFLSDPQPARARREGDGVRRPAMTKQG